MHETRPRLGQMLVDARILTPEQLEQVLALQKVDGRRLGTLLVEIGLVTETQLTQVLSQQLSVPWVSLYHIDFSRELLSLIPRETADKYCLVPIYVRPVRGLGDTLYVAMDDPMNEEALVACSCSAGLPTRAMIAAPSDIRKAIRLYYAGAQSMPMVKAASVRSVPDDGGIPDEPSAAPLGRAASGAKPMPKPPSERAALGAFLKPASPPKAASRPPGPPLRVNDESASPLEDALSAASGELAVAPLEDEDAVLLEQGPDDAGQGSGGSPSDLPNSWSIEPAEGSALSDEEGVPTPASPASSATASSAAASSATASFPPVSSPLASSPPEPARAPLGSESLSASVAARETPPETPRVDNGQEVAPEVEVHEIELPRRPRAKGRSLTLLDGTTIALGAPPPKKRAPAAGGTGRQPTAADVVAALRTASHRAAREGRSEDARWQKVTAALLSLLLRKHLILDAEFIEELKKM